MTSNKTSKLILLAATLLVISFIIKTPVALACSCMMPGTPGQELKKSTAVFSGTVLSFDRDSARYGYNVEFATEKIWKGEINKTVSIFTGMGPADCGYQFIVGEKYFVYASGDDSLGTGICSRTKLLAAAEDDLSALGEGKVPTLQPEVAAGTGVDLPVGMLFIIIFAGIVLILVIYKVFLARQKVFIKPLLIVLVVTLIAILGYLVLVNKPFNFTRPTALIYPTGEILIPVDTKLVQDFKFDFENDGIDEIAVVYSANNTKGLKNDTGLLISARQSNGKWQTVYSQPPVSGAGVQISVDSIKAPDNTQGLFVLESFTGAGSLKDWYIITKEMIKLDRRPALDQILETKESVFLGYNDAKVVSNTVVETVSGYSKTAAQCCPDKPSLVITYKFTGIAIEAVSITEQSKP